MTLAQAIAINWSGDGSPALNGSVPLTGDGAIIADAPIINGTQSIICGIRATGLSGLYLKSDVACTVTFRDGGGTSVGAVTLVATVPYVWVSWLGTIPISDYVASLSVSASAAGTLQIRGMQDTTPAAATAALSGTLQSTHLESGIVSGSYTVILTLTGATWVDAGAAFNAQRQAIIDGLVSAQSEANGWNNTRPSIAVTAVARTSASVVTITLPALGSYAITADETITATVPVPATTAESAIVASPTVTVTANS